MKIGITFSAFDLLHAGHVKMLEDAKDNAII
jgi:glycerol-3-phosphate cytidylyltransferase